MSLQDFSSLKDVEQVQIFDLDYSLYTHRWKFILPYFYVFHTFDISVNPFVNK